LEELIESRTAFENVLNILNNELVVLSKKMKIEKENQKINKKKNLNDISTNSVFVLEKKKNSNL